MPTAMSSGPVGPTGPVELWLNPPVSAMDATPSPSTTALVTACAAHTAMAGTNSPKMGLCWPLEAILETANRQKSALETSSSDARILEPATTIRMQWQTTGAVTSAASGAPIPDSATTTRTPRWTTAAVPTSTSAESAPAMARAAWAAPIPPRATTTRTPPSTMRPAPTLR